MMSDTLDDLWPYALCALPSVLVAWSWIQFRKQVMLASGGWRRLLASLILSTISSLTLMLFPGVLQYLESTGSQPGDGWYIRSVQVGFVAAVAASATSLFAIGRQRALLAATGILLSALWFLVGVLY